MLLAKMGLHKPIHYLLLLLAAGALVASPAHAQISNVDPNDAIDADLGTPPAGPDTSTQAAPMAQGATVMQDGVPTDAMLADGSGTQAGAEAARVAVPTGDTYQGDDLIGAAEGVFGKGAQGLALLIEDILKKQGRPNGYIVGREGGGVPRV